MTMDGMTTSSSMQDVLNASGTQMNKSALTPLETEDFGIPGTTALSVVVPSLILLMLITIVANIIVMICVRIDKRLASSISSIYVFSLAIADAIVGLFVMAGMSLYTVFGYWPIGPVICTVWISIDFPCCTVSMLHLCLIAYDRYEAVVHPIDYRQNRNTKEAILRAVAAWVVGFIAWLPAIIIFRVITPGPEYACYYMPVPLYILLQALIVYFGPIIIMLVFYVQCLSFLRQRYLKTVATANNDPKPFIPSESTTTTTTDGESGKNDGGDQQEANNNSQSNPVENPAMVAANLAKLSKHQQQLRSIRTLGVVMGVFLFCWLPFCLFWPISAYCADCISPAVYEYAYWFTYINSTVNPFLYFLSNRDFRNAFMIMIGRGTQQAD